ncbi:MAG: hypothetical protein ACLU36_01125 [Barnesiella intestinihominis]
MEQNNKLYTTTDGSGKFTATEAEAIYLPTDGSRASPIILHGKSW